MSNIILNDIFANIEKLTQEDGQKEFLASFYPVKAEYADRSFDGYSYNSFALQICFLRKIMREIDNLSTNIKIDDSILISVKNQKLLRTSYQIITSLGISQCLIPGLGVKLTKRCLSAVLLPSLDFTDEQKYEMLTECVDFFTRSYNIPVLKKIIITLHLSDYLAALIQLSFAPLKKPGKYGNFIMTEELQAKLIKDRKIYIETYEYLVVNCFQPTIMKELLVIQSVNDPCPPLFVKRVISKELSRRLLAPGGLLSLIRCFMDSYNIDTGYDWKKIDMISKIVGTKHGNDSELSYLSNICLQLTQILSLNNTHYLTTAIACILGLNEKYPNTEPVGVLLRYIFEAFHYKHLLSLSNLPGTIILTSQEITHKVNLLNASINVSNFKFPHSSISPNLYVLFLLGMKCTKNENLGLKLRDVLLKFLQLLDEIEIANTMNDLLFRKRIAQPYNIEVEEYDSGLVVKSTSMSNTLHKYEEALNYFLHLLKSSPENFVMHVFKTALQLVIDLNEKRKRKTTTEILLPQDEPTVFDDLDEQYAIVLQLLSEISTFPKIVTVLKASPSVVLHFIEHFILRAKNNIDDECLTIALVLLNTVLSNSNHNYDAIKRFRTLIPVLQSISKDEYSMVGILSKESLTLITSDNQVQTETKFKKAITDSFDTLLPVKAHGLIVLTKLIEAKDIETMSKKHYVFCLFLEQLKDSDSYIYLSAINGISSLATHFTDDVLHVLCNEFLKISNDHILNTQESQNKIAELRMKIGDVIVKVTKKLGELAVVHKTILLNTMLCGCRDEDPLIRTSALSNLAEIALVLHYKMGSIIYEILHCVWAILETDKAIECRRAAVLIIASLIKGLGKDVLIELKENLMPIYRTLKKLYYNTNEDSILRLHAQIGLEELNDIVNQFMFPDIKMEKQIFVLEKPNEILK